MFDSSPSVRRRIAASLAGTLCCAFAAAAPAAEVSPGVVRFALCRSNIAGTDLIRSSGDWGFVVKIQRDAAKSLTQAARRNVGATLEIVMGDFLLHRAPIDGVGDGSQFSSISGELSDAKRNLELFRNNIYEGPCGVVSEPEALP